ncbi:hypothetical protein ACU8KH_03883 [Lachancea thermotolerans]
MSNKSLKELEGLDHQIVDRKNPLLFVIFKSASNSRWCAFKYEESMLIDLSSDLSKASIISKMDAYEQNMFHLADTIPSSERSKFFGA